MSTSQDQAWTPPGAGRWALDNTATRTPTHYRRSIEALPIERGWQAAIERYGLPLAAVRSATINGWPYLRFVPLTSPDADLVARRAAAATASRTLRPWRDAIRRWDDSDRSAQTSRNHALQEVVPAVLSDSELADHLGAATANDTAGHEYAQGGAASLIAVGEYLLACEAWGVDRDRAIVLLNDSRPAPQSAAERLADVAAPLRRRGVPGESLEQIESDPDAAACLRAFLEDWGWRLLAGADVDEPTLIEIPTLLVATIRAALSRDQDPPGHTDSSISPPSQVSDESGFAALLEDSRRVIRMREEVAGICCDWTRGLLRRALLETSIRLSDRGALQQLEHGVDLLPEEAMSLLRGQGGPTMARVAERSAERARQDLLDAPAELVSRELSGRIERLPEPMTHVATALALASSLVATEPHAASPAPEGLVAGTGIGDVVVQGHAVVARSEQEALHLVERDTILVVPSLSTGFAPLLPLLRGLVVETGGRLSHGAVLAAEADLPVITGAESAVSSIEPGALIELDTAAGTIQTVERSDGSTSASRPIRPT